MWHVPAYAIVDPEVLLDMRDYSRMTPTHVVGVASSTEAVFEMVRANNEMLAAAATQEKKRAKEAKEAEERAKLPLEEQKAKEELETVKKAWDKSMREAKALVDRGNRELAEVKLVEAKLAEKSFNKEPLEYLRSNTAATQGVMDSLFSVWIDEKQWNKTSWKLENYSESKTKVVTATTTSQAALKQYKDEVLSQFLKATK